MEATGYLRRIGLEPDSIYEPDLATLARIQQAHVTSVPFETLSITGHPHREDAGEGVSLSLPDLYEKIVDRRRGGFCFELNGLFGWLLAELGYERDRVASMMLSDDGDPSPPANHHTNVVTLDGRRYVVDVGMGIPVLRRPLPLDGEELTDEVGVDWRVGESDRPDADYVTQYRKPGEDDWSNRYVFRDVPRELSYFEATCEYLATAPESTFTGDPVVSIATGTGHRKLTRETVTRSWGAELEEEAVSETDWDEVLQNEFGIALDREPGLRAGAGG
ncbi:arylamine N-acetyltransferase family protein [Haloarchaeobius amylolyticus]|uniref:arylamine N-acetyltransferase family protein n=1 Tax=Haloarchaeobius amylolyticus TaxID=1198296 RepID=UPI00226DBD1E|nr:arylamine N-acetyltransferase [Haloarchaeobius amylolyticus]